MLATLGRSSRLTKNALSSSALSAPIIRSYRTKPFPTYEAPETDEWLQFPREREGKVYTFNWSLNQDKVYPSGQNAFQNARLQLLLNRMGHKAATAESVEIKTPLVGKSNHTILEAGDSITHEQFNELASEVQEHFSSGIDVFAEDSVVGSHQEHQLGVRVISEDPAISLIARTLFFSSPPRDIDHRARAKGWNLSSEWKKSKDLWRWDGSQYTNVGEAPLPGQRPIVVYYGGKSDKVAVQFIEFQQEIVGADIVIGGSLPASALLSAVGYAASVIFNQAATSVLVLPSSTSFVKGKKSVVVVNGSDDLISSVVSGGASLYGKQFNVISKDSLSTLFRGSVGKKPSSFASHQSYGIPGLTESSNGTLLHVPDNQTFPTKQVIIFDKSSTNTSSKLSNEDAVKKLLTISDSASDKENYVKNLLETGLEVHQISKEQDISKFLA